MEDGKLSGYVKRLTMATFLLCGPLAFAGADPETTEASSHTEEPGYLERALANPDQREIAMTMLDKAPKTLDRIVAQIEVLEKEDPAESLKRLWDLDMYYWPISMVGIRFPTANYLSPDAGRYYIRSVLSNRRFLKVFDELSQLSRAEAAELVSGELLEALSISRDLIDPIVANGWLYKESEPRVSYGFSAGAENEDGTPTSEGARLKVFALLLIIGNLGLTEARPAVDEVIDVAVRQRNILYGRTSTDKKQKWLCGWLVFTTDWPLARPCLGWKRRSKSL